MSYLGDINTSDIIDTKFTTVAASTGAPTTLSGTPAISVYKDNSTTQSTSGVTLSVDFDSVTGLNNVRIDTSSDGSFYAAGSNFQIVITTGTVGGTSAVGYVVGEFSIQKRAALRPTTAGRTLDVSAGGEAGVDWANVGSPTTTLNLSGTTVKTATDVETDTADIQSRLPAALVSGRMSSDVIAISGDTTAADNAEAFFDGTGYAGTNNVIPTVSSVTAIATGGITAASIAADAIGASELAADAVAEIADAVWDEVLSGHLTASTTGNALNAAGAAGDPWTTALPGAYGSGTAGKIIGDNINATISSRASQSSLDTVDDFLDTEIAAIKAKTDNLPSDPADASDIATATSAIAGYIDTEVAAILAAVDTEVAAIKAKTDNLPSDPADASDIASSFSTVNSTLSTIAGYVDTEVASVLAAVDTEVAAIKAKTDQLVFTTAGQIDATAITVSDKTGYSIAAGQLFVKKNTALSNFTFVMTDSSTNAPLAGLTVTATRSIDGAAFGACANSVTEISSGFYKINLAAADLNGTVIALRFTASGANDRTMTVITQA